MDINIKDFSAIGDGKTKGGTISSGAKTGSAKLGGAKAGSKGGTQQFTNKKIPADISEEKTKEIQGLAKDVFRTLGCSGVSRIDFLIDTKTDKVYVNEINTIPGALSYYLWEATGKTFEKERTKHPTQKPEALIMELIKAFCPKDNDGKYCGTILDPFHGSGTLGVCCEKLNAQGHCIQWIGIELERCWCDVAEKRIAEVHANS